jgi:NitT/TauT family transport system substrate-binding protein
MLKRAVAFLVVPALCLGVALPARAEPYKLKVAAVGAPPSMHNMYLHVAFEEGMFAANGLQVDKLLQLGSGPLATQAVTSGQVDVTETDVEGVLNAATAGGGVIAVSAPAQHVSYAIVVAPEITMLADLAGKKFAISRPGALSQYLLFPAMAKAGLARSAITWVPIGGASERRSALVAGRVQGGLLHLDFALQAQRDANLRILDEVANSVPDYPHELLVVRRAFATEHPDVVTALVRAVIEACRFIVTHRERTIAIYAKYSGETDAALAGRAYDALLAMHGFGVNGGMTEAAMQNAVRLAVENGVLPAPPALSDWTDFRFQQEAVAALGPVAE